MRRARRGSVTMVALLVLAALAVGAVGARALLLWAYPLPHRELVLHYAAQHRLNPHLVAAVIRVESRWRPDATSRKGAVGLMQIMPATGEWAAARMGLAPPAPAQLYDPDLNIRIGTWYLAYLLQQFKGNHALALAAYNSGDHTVRRWLQQRRWAGDEKTLHQIPYPETRRYVTRVLQDWRIYQRVYRLAEARPGQG